MTQRAQVTIRFAYSKGGTTIDKEYVFYTTIANLDSTDMIHTRMPVTTGGVTFAVDGAKGGYAIVKNHDATNFVTIVGATATLVSVRVNAGEIAIFRLDDDVTSDCDITADTASCDCEWWIFPP